MEFSKFYTKLGCGIFNRHSGEISSGIDNPSFAALSVTVLIHVDKSKLARSAAACSTFNCPTLTLILMISVFRSWAAFLGVFFIDGNPFPRHNVWPHCGLTKNGVLNASNPEEDRKSVNRPHCTHIVPAISYDSFCSLPPRKPN
jgi:hypothetical protein